MLPSESEGFGLPVVEAMACGKPVVNTNLDSGVPTVSLDGMTGLTVPPHDPHALAKAINTLLDDAKLSEAYGRAARSRVELEFNQEVMSERMVKLYSEVLSVPVGERRTSLTEMGAEATSSSPELSRSASA